MTEQNLALRTPSQEILPGYVAALETGWSPSTTRDVSGEQLASIRVDAEAFLSDLNRHEGGGTITMPDGSQVPRLPGRIRWIWDGEFCGSINFRHVPGTEDLPEHVSGHIGYSVVPWKRRRGYATRALALILPIAAEHGLSRVAVTCDHDNQGSRRVIEANKGILAGQQPLPERPGHSKLHFWVPTT